MTDATRYTSRLTAAIALSMLLWVPTQLLAGDDTDSVIVHKQCIPDDAGGVFEITLLDDGGDPAIADQNPISIGCGESATFTGVEEGTYSAVEAILQGDFEETSNDCQGLDLDVAFPPPECTIVNEAPVPSSITIVKETQGGDGTFGFVSNLLGAFTITTAGGSGDMVFGDLPPGTYEIMENVPAGWTFTGIFCEQGDQTVIVIDPQNASVAIDLPQGDDVTCTFNNTAVTEPTTTITIVKTATGGDGETFGFSGDLGDFDITIAGTSGSQSFPGMPAGTYNVTEVVPAGWALAALSCDNADSSIDLVNATATVVVTANDIHVSCFFTNREQTVPLEPAAIPILSRPALAALVLLLVLAALWTMIPDGHRR